MTDGELRDHIAAVVLAHELKHGWDNYRVLASHCFDVADDFVAERANRIAKANAAPVDDGPFVVRVDGGYVTEYGTSSRFGSASVFPSLRLANSAYAADKHGSWFDVEPYRVAAERESKK